MAGIRPVYGIKCRQDELLHDEKARKDQLLMGRKTMTYEEFIEKLIQNAHDELGFDPSRMEFYPEGYEATDAKDKVFVKDSNLRFTGDDGTALKTDFLVMKRLQTDGVEELHRMATRRMYETYQKEGFEAAFEP